MFSRSLVFVVSALAVVASGYLAPRDASTFITDLKSLEPKLNALKDSIDKFPGNSPLAAGIVVHNAALAVDAAVKQAVTDGKGVPSLSSSDATTVYSLTHGAAPLIVDILKALVTKKTSFQALPLGGVNVVKRDLATLNNDTLALEEAIGGLIPASQLKDDFSAINTAFNSTISAFA